MRGGVERGRDIRGARDHEEVDVDSRELVMLEVEESSEMLGEAVPRRNVGVCMRGSRVAEGRRGGVALGVKLVVRCREANVDPYTEKPIGPDADLEDEIDILLGVLSLEVETVRRDGEGTAKPPRPPREDTDKLA